MRPENYKKVLEIGALLLVEMTQLFIEITDTYKTDTGEIIDGNFDI